ncbi:DUF92 domain-containing protein [Mucilaginibacter daejeonensis]|uniref:DUF92 domain-containing protein n=1 Tax=Mucilaginibacter daejeonensis TaxID=398049 RepID=UPI001D1763E4|nr:DUF92 domain-containing protein [Mucilaginibacter daejeonensis]UEG55141.1 DUF92 domain-containing protein [Mucilaginibacter daejeonensis]
MTFNIPLLIFLLTGMALSVAFKKLTLTAATCGVVCALLVYAGAGYTGVIMMTTFFVIGTLATSHKASVKQVLVTEGPEHQRRTITQVLANAGVPALAGLFSLLTNEGSAIWQLSIAAAFSAATADTMASELGTVYGKRFYNILSMRPDQRGADGVVSLEGTLIGVLGSSVIALISVLGNEGTLTTFFLIMVSGTAGNLMDSILGAALERRGVIKNDMVNFINTLTAALIAIALFAML